MAEPRTVNEGRRASLGVASAREAK